MGGPLDALSMPYVFQHEDAFALGIGVLIVGLLLFRFGLTKRRRRENSAGR